MGQLNALDDLSVPAPAAAVESQLGGQPGDFEQLCGVEFAADDIGNALGAVCAPARKRPAPSRGQPPPLPNQGGFPQSGSDAWAAASRPQQCAPPSQPSKKKFRRRAGQEAEGGEEEEEERRRQQQQQPLSGVDIWSQEFASSVQQQWALPPAFSYAAQHPPTAAARRPPSRSSSSSRAAASHVDEEGHMPASHVAALRDDCSKNDDVDLQSLLHRHGRQSRLLCRRSTRPCNACPAAAGLSGSSSRLNKIATGFSPRTPPPINNRPAPPILTRISPSRRKRSIFLRRISVRFGCSSRGRRRITPPPGSPLQPSIEEKPLQIAQPPPRPFACPAAASQR
jgi:hypothetical protein